MALSMSMFATPADYWKARAELAEKALARIADAPVPTPTQVDAMRYRWLRSKVTGHRAVSSARPATFAFPGPMDLPPLRDIMRGSVAQHLDAAIDAAMADPAAGGL